MLVGLLRVLLWGAVMGLCLGTLQQSGRSWGHGCLHKRQAGSEPGQGNSRIPRKYCNPAGNSSSSGNIIQVCGPGQYREWQGPFEGLCVSCSCHGLSHKCDPITGRCLNCQYNTAGDHCEHCAEGYYGDAVQRTCKLCPCPFSVLSNSFALGCMQVGSDVECVCKPGYTGLRCQRCSSGYYGNPLLPFGGCQPCNCNHGNANKCHPLTGECENPDGTGDCQECDICVVTLMKDLEGMDDELSRLKSKLGKLTGSSIPLAQLKKLEEAITVTRELLSRLKASAVSLEPKVKQLEMDMGTIDEDLVTLDNKARKLFPQSEEVLKTVNHTKHRSQELLNSVGDLLDDIQDLLDQIARGNHTSGPVSDKDAVRMLGEAKHLVQEMRRQNCSGQRTVAHTELRQAQNLLDYITRNLTDPSSTNQALADRIGGSLMRDLARLRDLQKALEHAEGALKSTHKLNHQSQATLRRLQSRAMELRESKDSVTSGLQMTRQLLGNVSDQLSMMQDIKTEYEHLAAQLDGAESDLVKKLGSLSSLASVAGLVQQAEIHARNLSDLAMALSMKLQSVVKGSNVHHFFEVIRAYTDIIEAVEKAETAAREAKEAADSALEDVTRQNLISRASSLIVDARSLLSKAKEAEKNLNDTAEELGSQQERVGRVKDKMAALWRDLQASQQNLSMINRGDTDALLNSTKEAVSSAEARVKAMTTRLQEISAGLKNISVPSAGAGSGGSDLDGVLNQANNALQALNQTFPTLVDTLADVENMSALAPPGGNMLDSMRHIRELIEQTRQMANAIKVPMMFTGKGYVELRPPADLRDLRAVTTLDLYLQRPPLEPPRGDSNSRRRRRQGREKAENTFVFYLGNKNASEDFVGMTLRNNVLYSMYRLGGVFHSMEITNVTRSPRDPAHFDRVDFNRVYQDLEVIYTRGYTSKSPVLLPAFQLHPDSLHNLLHLDPGSTVFYVGGFPHNFTPPAEMGLGLSLYRGCIESSTLSHRLLGLYNFHRVVNVNQKQPCVRQVSQDKTEQLYFDGTGYGTVNITQSKTRRRIEFSVKSSLRNALLFYIGNERSYYSVIVEKGHLVLTGRQGDQVHSNRTATEVFPTARDTFKKIDIVFNDPDVKVLGETHITIPYSKDVYNFFYIGGVPLSLRERDGITAPALKGSLQNWPKVDSQRETLIEMLGVMRGFRENLLAVREADFSADSSLTEAQEPFKDTISLGFKTAQPGSVLLQTAQGAQGIKLSLTDGRVEFKYGSQAVMSERKYHDGRWHYLTALRKDSGLKLTIDDSDTGSDRPNSTPVVTDGNNLTLGREVFIGCLADLYMRRPGQAYLPSDLSQFHPKGNVNLGVCGVERPPQAIRATALKQKQTNKHRMKKSGSGPDVCRPPVGLLQAYSLTSPASQLSFHIPPEELNYRPHFSLVMKTTSTEGLILHIRGKQNGAHVTLYMTSGKIRLMVGNRSIHYHKKINDNHWHKVDLSVEKYSFHLLVDNLRVTDGQLPAGEGAALSLSSPVYLGADLTTPNTEAQRKSVPRASVTGCIYNFKFYNELVGEPLTKAGISPCFDSKMESGVFFSGEGAYMASHTPLMVDADFHLTFAVRPRDVLGLLFHARGHHRRSISVYLQSNQIIARANDGGGDYTVSIAISHNLCDSFHTVSVYKQKNSIKLELDFKSRHVRGPLAASYSSSLDSLYFGGIPGDLQAQHVPVRRSYVGCLRDVRLNGEDVSLGSLYTPHGPVSLQGCPVN